MVLSGKLFIIKLILCYFYSSFFGHFDEIFLFSFSKSFWSFPSFACSLGDKIIKLGWEIVRSSARNPLFGIDFFIDKVIHFIFAYRHFRLVYLSLVKSILRIIRIWRQTRFHNWFYRKGFVNSCVLQVLINTSVILVEVRSLFLSPNEAFINIALSIRFEFETPQKSTFSWSMVNLISCRLWEFQFLFSFLNYNRYSVSRRFLIQHILSQCQIFGNVISIGSRHMFNRFENRIHIMSWFVDVLMEA